MSCATTTAATRSAWSSTCRQLSSPRIFVGRVSTRPDGSKPVLLVRFIVGQRVLSKHPFRNRLPLGQVFLDKPRNAFGRHAVVPGPFRIHHHRWPVTADSQTTDLRPLTRVWRRAEIVFLH